MRRARLSPLSPRPAGVRRQRGSHPSFVNGLVVPGNTLDATREPGANAGRFGHFSDLYYDPVRHEWWALSDRGPGGGLLDYGTRVQRIDLDVHPFTGRISNFRIKETVRLDRSGNLLPPGVVVNDEKALNGLNPQLLNGNAAVLGTQLRSGGAGDRSADGTLPHRRRIRAVGLRVQPERPSGRCLRGAAQPRPDAAGALDYVAGRAGGSSGSGGRTTEATRASRSARTASGCMPCCRIRSSTRARAATRATPRTTTDVTAGTSASSCSTTTGGVATYRQSIAQYVYQLEPQAPRPDSDRSRTEAAHRLPTPAGAQPRRVGDRAP